MIPKVHSTSNDSENGRFAERFNEKGKITRQKNNCNTEPFRAVFERVHFQERKNGYEAEDMRLNNNAAADNRSWSGGR